ncbi:MAG TPA: fumarylacetoacetate hydrolase family protein [Gaiellaceae bacterium]
MSGFGVFSHNRVARLGWRCGDHVLDLAAAGVEAAFSLEDLFAEGRGSWDATVERARAAELAGAEPRYPLEDVKLLIPFMVADYVDFSASLEHATNMGRLFRPDGDALLPNWRHLPVGYHGRAGSVVVSGTEIPRPSGQLGEGEFGPTRALDFEVELGFVVGAHASTFRDSVFGVVMLNDWSARDIQAWEYRPLGPFLGKSFATSISAWVTPLALLEDSRVPAVAQEPEPLEYLRVGRDWALDVATEIEVNGVVIGSQNTRSLYWTGPQFVAHLTSNGSKLRAGDLLGTGTISGPDPGSLIERGGDYLEDGDEVVIRGRAGEVELGDVRGRITRQL